ncbi:MAG TPA: 4Fe-4S binding protein [Thermoanaerobacterales bacterium]|jgi:pyruvate ferredoxin oxidoreductase delta subunit|nr:4Fe-4S binding protein [Thermoanaerobacterales bacterium]
MTSGVGNPCNKNFGQGRRTKAINSDLPWKELTKAGNIYEPGNSNSYETGDWRTLKPVWNEERCIHCLICWRYCPDASIIVTNEKFDSFDYKHCKGCGICANVCPAHAIDMITEEQQPLKKKEAKKDE